VCGVAASSQQVQLVPNVDEFPGHIACDGDTKSEIVVPVVVDGKTVAVVDVDCTALGGFDRVDEEGLRELATLLAEGCDW
jgi:putative methionine-R-sulfoxide reductase with GAF domain